ncbi:MAG: hypothetical protein NTU63_02990 [Candidatus Pacearchaeota archaeon]|nr:hypothetical protein [Candidatus Pacearchaeota archaeon]
MHNKRGQVTIFIIVAILIVAGVIGFFILRQQLSVQFIPANLNPVYKTFLSCLEDKTLVGIDVLESQAGYIELPAFKPGNSYMPFSSQLNFLGNPIPYWYYVSENNLQREQVPSKEKMEEQLKKFVEDNAKKCDFENDYANGFEIVQGEPKATVTIRNNNVNVKLSMNFDIAKGEDKVLVKNHDVSVQSKLGTLYNSARKVYDKEQKELFLENYGVDTLRLYAPVDGVEISCSPKIWNADEVFNNLKDAIEMNTFALTTQASSKENKYFVVDVPVSEQVRFINSRNWSNSFEVSPSEGSILISNPVGNQPGLGILGFCYVTYHFVYSVKYPVLIQVSSGDETFQFPVAVVIQGNKPREALNSEAKAIGVELCAYKNTLVNVRTYDTSLNPVNSHISYECFGEICDIGDASSGLLSAEFPQCANGFVVATATNFEETKQLYSTTQSGDVNVIMDKLYNLNVRLKLDGKDYNEKAIISFTSEEGNSKVVSYPEQKSVKLTETQYEVQAYIYRDSSIQFPETSYQQCIDVPTSGIGGLFGMKEKKCFDIKIPSQTISSVPAGGGTQQYYPLESELKNSNTIEINAKGLAVPKSLEEIQTAYAALESNGLDINLK